jgi:hypothetical protein
MLLRVIFMSVNIIQSYVNFLPVLQQNYILSMSPFVRCVLRIALYKQHA